MISNYKQWFSFNGRFKILHMSWVAFFLSFFVWFNFAPLATTIKRSLGLNDGQIKTLFICNIVLTIPARIIIGMLVDRFGPRKTYSSLLLVMSIPCFLFSMAQSFEQLVVLRLFMGFIGAGFVIGIRMIGEWFGPKEVGLAEGVYGGWGNFGSAAAAFTLPAVAVWFSGAEGWRLAVGLSGALCVAFVIPFYKTVRDTPSGKTYFSPKKISAMEVSSYKDMMGLMFMTLPMVLCLALLVWKLNSPGINFISTGTATGLYGFLFLLLAYQIFQIWRVNKDRLKTGVAEPDKYEFKQVAILDLAYAVSFGSELAVVSMLPSFFEKTFSLGIAQAGLIGSSFAFMNLLARPVGGLSSDKFGRRKTMMTLFFGLGMMYMVLSQVTGAWPLPLTVMAVMMCSFFVQSAEGAVFSIVPLIKRRLTGQIAGMVGAYGNVGAVVFLTVYSLTNEKTFFLTIGAAAVLSFVANLFLKDPRGQIMEIQPDGSVEMLEVA